MYIESKDGLVDGSRARIGWVTFSKTGKSVYYRGLTLNKARTASGNFLDADSGDEYWVSGVKKRGSNSHPAERRIDVKIDDDALDEYNELRATGEA
jgi:hypothetical protein